MGKPIQAICVHDDGYEHPSDGTLPCQETRLAEIERIATLCGEKNTPGYPQWKRDKAHPDGGYEEWVESPGADASTMLVFRADDGYNSMRSLTWREVVTEVFDAMDKAAVAASLNQTAEKGETR